MVNGESGDKAPAKSKTRIIIWICLGVAFVAIGFTFVNVLPFSPGTPSVEVEQPPQGPGAYIPLGSNNGEFITNLAPPDDVMVISVTIKVELEADQADTKLTEKLTQELEAKDALMQNIVEEVLRTKTKKDLSSLEGVDGMKKEILRKVNANMTEGKARRVLLNSLIVQ